MQVNDGFVMPTVAEQLKNICEQNKIQDQDLVLDVYLVCNNHGKNQFIPDETLIKDIERTDPTYWQHRLEASKRKEFLEKVAASNYMQALIQLNDPMKAVLTFVDHLRKAHEARMLAAKSRQAIDLRGNPVQDYHYGSFRSDTEKVLEAAAQDEISFDDIVGELITYPDALQSDEGAAFMEGCGTANTYTATESPGRTLAKSVVQHGTNLPALYPMIFDQFTKIVDKLGVSQVKEVDTDAEKNRKKKDQMEDHAQVTSVDPSEVANDTFDVRMANKNLAVDFNKDEEEGLSHLFILLDVSGSMQGTDLGERVSRALAANVITLALLRFAMTGRYKVYVAPFEGRVKHNQVQTATNRAEALDAMRWLGAQNYDGGSTNIESAVLWAYTEVAKDAKYRKCDVVIITDGASRMSGKLSSLKPRDTKVRTLYVCGSRPDYGDTSLRELAKASDTFTHLTWDDKKQEFTIGDALAGINAVNSSLGE